MPLKRRTFPSFSTAVTGVPRYRMLRWNECLEGGRCWQCRLLEEVQRYEGLLSLSVAAAYIEAAGTNTSEGLRRAACSPRTSVGLWVESAWVLNLHATFPVRTLLSSPIHEHVMLKNTTLFQLAIVHQMLRSRPHVRRALVIERKQRNLPTP